MSVVGLLVNCMPFSWLTEQLRFADRWRHRRVSGLATGIKCDLLTLVDFMQLIVKVLY